MIFSTRTKLVLRPPRTLIIKTISLTVYTEYNLPTWYLAIYPIFLSLSLQDSKIRFRMELAHSRNCCDLFMKDVFTSVLITPFRQGATNPFISDFSIDDFKKAKVHFSENWCYLICRKNTDGISYLMCFSICSFFSTLSIMSSIYSLPS